MNLLFLWIPRTGGHSITDALGLQLVKRSHRPCPPGKAFRRGALTFKHSNIHNLLRRGYLTDEFLSDVLVFTVVRNPWDRIVSAACHEWQRSGKARGVPSVRAMFDEIIEDIDFGEDTTEGLAGPWRCRPQANWLVRSDGRIVPDLMVRHENLQCGLNQVCDIVGLPKVTLRGEPISNRRFLRTESPYHNKKTIEIVRHYKRRLLQLVDYDYDGS